MYSNLNARGRGSSFCSNLKGRGIADRTKFYWGACCYPRQLFLTYPLVYVLNMSLNKLCLINFAKMIYVKT